MIIQGGMGAGVSGWRLAHAVSELGHLGVVSGTALDVILARRLQDGDSGGHIRRALDQFPFSDIAGRIWRKFYIPGGKRTGAPYTKVPQHAKDSPQELQELCIAGNFVEVFLARNGHQNPVGINYLEKIQLPHLPSIYGAMLAGVDYVLMGAGIPLRVPGVLSRFVTHDPATYPLTVANSQQGDDTTMIFSPRDFMERNLPPLVRPKFLAIISSNTLAATMVKKSNGIVDGLIVEKPYAGGHNAPPRGKVQLSENGEPIYGERDRVDLDKLRSLGLPFWLAGGYGSPEKLVEALEAGATGIQVGTAFAFCAESGLRSDYKNALLRNVVSGTARVFTDPVASSTGFPFKVAQLEDSLSERAVYLARPRICDLGYLREAYKTPEGTIGFRCSAEPETIYASKGGNLEDTPGRRCLCNALLANIGHPQARTGDRIEAGIVTSGDDLLKISRFFPANGLTYTAADVIAKLMNGRSGSHL